MTNVDCLIIVTSPTTLLLPPDLEVLLVICINTRSFSRLFLLLPVRQALLRNDFTFVIDDILLMREHFDSTKIGAIFFSRDSAYARHANSVTGSEKIPIERFRSGGLTSLGQRLRGTFLARTGRDVRIGFDRNSSHRCLLGAEQALGAETLWIPVVGVELVGRDIRGWEAVQQFAVDIVLENQTRCS